VIRNASLHDSLIGDNAHLENVNGIANVGDDTSIVGGA
jgi:hypothetical protein